MTPPTNQNGPVHPPGAPGSTPAAAGDVIHALDPAKGVHCKLNCPFRMDDVIRDLVPSLRSGQLQPGLVCEVVDQPDLYEVLIGNRRLAGCRFLGFPFLARKLGQIPTDAEKIKIILAENLKRKDMTQFQIADAIKQYIRASGCKQGEAAELLDLQESVISKAMTVDANLAPDLRPLVEAGKIGSTVSYLIATIPDHVTQLHLGKRVAEHGLKRDAVAKLVKQLKGGKERTAKPMEIACGGVTARVTGNPVETLRAFAAKVGEALRKLEKDSLPPDLLPALMK